MRDFLIEYWQFIRVNKSYWLIPFLAILFLFGVLLIATQGAAVAPLVYTFF
jgi:hypothetical protein